MRKIKKAIAAAMALFAALSMTGCMTIFRELKNELQSVMSEMSSISESISQEEAEGLHVSDDDTLTLFEENSGGTQISRISGEMRINRRTRFEEKPMGKSGWTIFMYLCGTDLESDIGSATTDLKEAARGLKLGTKLDDNVRFIVQTGGTKRWHNTTVSNRKIERYECKNGEYKKIMELPDANMGSADTLSSFLEWGVTNYPAEKMGLIFWNHGGGSISGVCFDEKHDRDSLSLREIDKALGSVYDKMTDRFEFIGFDACLMATLETANILVPYARYMLASQEIEQSTGWDYEALVGHLAKSPETDGAKLGVLQCGWYIDHCLTASARRGATFSAVDLSRIDELILALDKVGKEIYYSKELPEIAKNASLADNFGGNNRIDGYTNMVDLLGVLENISPFSPSAKTAVRALENCVVKKVSGSRHESAGGLSIYYPLSVQGSTELSTFRDICPSTYYLAFVDKVAYGTTGKDPLTYDNSWLIKDTDDIWEEAPDGAIDNEIGSNTGEFADADGSCPITITDVYFDENGIYTVEAENLEYMRFAACSVFMNDSEGDVIYLGKVDDINVDYENGRLTDNFTGEWININGMTFPLEVVHSANAMSVYSCPILLNGNETTLQIIYERIFETWSVSGLWSGIDSATGMASREELELKDGDKIQPIYYYTDKEENDSYFVGNSITVFGDLEISYEALPFADYYYSMALYDIYGNVWYTPRVTFTVKDDGYVYFTKEELENLPDY